LTRLRSVGNTPQNFVADVYYRGPQGELSNTHNININEDTGFAYLVGCTGGGANCGGLYIVDINDPKNPQKAACHSPRYTHDTECIVYDGPDTRYTGREICYCFDAGYGMTIKDVTNKNSIQTIGVMGSYGPTYCHQGWVSDNREFVLMNDELGPTGRTYVFNVTNLQNPTCIYQQGSQCYYNHGNDQASSAQHNNYIIGGYVFQANYRSGVRILDVSDQRTLSLAGYLETSLYDPNTGGFNGQWSIYPFLPSGTVVANDIENGLFVFQFQGQHFHLVTSQDSIQLCGSAKQKVRLQVKTFKANTVGEVNFLVNGLPEEIKVQFGKSPLKENEVTDLTFSSEKAAAGSYEFTLTAIDSKSGKTVQKKMVLDVFPANPEFNYEVVPQRNGEYKVIYTANKPGTFPLNILLNNSPISGSPFVVGVTDSGPTKTHTQGTKSPIVTGKLTAFFSFAFILTVLVVLAVRIYRRNQVYRNGSQV